MFNKKTSFFDREPTRADNNLQIASAIYSKKVNFLWAPYLSFSSTFSNIVHIILDIGMAIKALAAILIIMMYIVLISMLLRLATLAFTAKILSLHKEEKDTIKDVAINMAISITCTFNAAFSMLSIPTKLLSTVIFLGYSIYMYSDTFFYKASEQPRETLREVYYSTYSNCFFNKNDEWKRENHLSHNYNYYGITYIGLDPDCDEDNLYGYYLSCC